MEPYRYAHFIQSSDDLWIPDKLTELNLAADVNPYALEDNTLASKLLRPTVYGLKKFILDPTIEEFPRFAFGRFLPGLHDQAHSCFKT